MMLSDEVNRENLHFPLKVTDLPSGECQIECSVVPNKVWVGPDLNTTLRKTQDDLRNMQDNRDINVLPAWMTDGSFSGTVILK